MDAPARTMPAIVPCAVGGLCLVCLAACSDRPGQSAKHLPRQGDAALVVYVEAPDNRSIEFIEEVEPNNQPDQATPMSLGGGVRGTLDGETDSDLYRLDIERDGFVAATVSGIENVDLILELQDANGQVLAISDRGPAMVVEGMPNFHVTRGRYYLAVREFVKKRPKPKKKRKKQAAEPVAEGRQGLSPVYELVVKDGPKNQPRQENEPNDNLELANEMLLGDQVTGYVGWARDTDVWKLSLEGMTAHYGLNIDLAGVPGASLQLQVFDERGGKVLERTADKDEGLSVRNLVVVPASEADSDGDVAADTGGNPTPAGATAGFYYHVQVSARRSNPMDAYQLRTSTRLLEPEDEIEPNDEPGDAQVLELDGHAAEVMRQGHLTPSDQDRYALTAGVEPISLSVTCTPLSDIDVKLEVTIDGATLGSSNEYRQSGKESLPDLQVPAGRTAIITVSGAGELAGDAGYRLSVISEPAPPGQLPLGQQGQPPDGTREGDGLLDEYRDESEQPE